MRPLIFFLAPMVGAPDLYGVKMVYLQAGPAGSPLLKINLSSQSLKLALLGFAIQAFEL